jgi:hypothetical protein
MDVRARRITAPRISPALAALLEWELDQVMMHTQPNCELAGRELRMRLVGSPDGV